MKKLVLFITMVGLFSSTPAGAADTMFLKYCGFLGVEADQLTKDEKAVTISCVAFIKGVLDTHSALALRKEIKPLYCKPARASYGDVGKMYVEYAEKHPPKSHHNEAEILLEALKAAYPCR